MDNPDPPRGGIVRMSRAAIDSRARRSGPCADKHRSPPRQHHTGGIPMSKTIGENLAILRDFGFVPEQSALILRVKHRQIYRWEAAEAYPSVAEQERLVLVVTIIERLRQVYNDEQAMCWLLRPNDSLSSNRSPYRAMLAGSYGAALSVAKADVLAAKAEMDGVTA